jgi:alkylresorcinol/alkylpyrone synthase
VAHPHPECSARIAAVGRALPRHGYDQATIVAEVGGLFGAEPELRAQLQVLHRRVKVQRRYLAVPLEQYAALDDFSKCNDAWIRCALDVGERAVQDALDRARLRPQDIDAFFFSTVTGLSSPSLDALLMNRLPFRPDVKRVPMFGLGCVAGAAAVARAADFVRAFPGARALVLTVELCSLTVQRSDRSTANLVSTGLFGDGAAAVVVAGNEHKADGPGIAATRSVFYPDTEDVMGWSIGSHGFRIVLSPAVPTVARERLPGDVDAFLGDHGLARADVRSWVCHPGGPKVLEALEAGLDLAPSALALSWESLASVGNLSSASVLFVLGDTMAHDRPPAGSLGVMLAMGPAFCSELVLLRW